MKPQFPINENELEFSFIRADGPGGENVNKVATAVQLRFGIVQSSSLPEVVKSRLIGLAGNRVTQDGRHRDCGLCELISFAR